MIKLLGMHTYYYDDDDYDDDYYYYYYGIIITIKLVVRSPLSGYIPKLEIVCMLFL